MSKTASPNNDASLADWLKPGVRVTVTQQVQRELAPWVDAVIGVVQSYEQRKTGSWFAHSKDDKLWLDRLTLELDDGEIVVLNLDAYSRVEPADAAQTTDTASDA